MPNTGNYCLVGVDEVLMGPMSLPKNWKNISGLNMMGNNDLKKHGWLPFEENEPAYNSVTHYRSTPTVDIQTDKVVYNQKLIAFTEQELKQNKWNDWMSDMERSDNADMDRNNEDTLDLLVSKYESILDTEGFANIKERHANKKTLRGKKPPTP